ncbi:hypothetical protein FHS19_000012 [Paenibacillus rhizosphaerae]|uniref:Uncharacterized protein n=1 Tax=Paenibacillus rhizosphaerae TaxID=297318 RepID=A0A839TJ00_9BACL|nr:hypothetical protein [Paenibacillus rhizosphaerae]
MGCPLSIFILTDKPYGDEVNTKCEVGMREHTSYINSCISSSECMEMNCITLDKISCNKRYISFKGDKNLIVIMYSFSYKSL